MAGVTGPGDGDDHLGVGFKDKERIHITTHHVYFTNEIERAPSSLRR
jgi:pectate lyase